MNNKIAIVIVNYNAGALLQKALESVHASTHENIDVVVVDNNSSDTSVEAAHAVFPEITILSQKENRGFGAGANTGARYAQKNGAEYIFFLNPDATISSDTLEKLLCAARKQKGAFNPTITNSATQETWFANGKINFLRMRAEHTTTASHKGVYETGYATGCALFLRTEDFAKIGFFDESFFLYYEDADLSMRAREKGIKTFVVSEAQASHEESSTVDEALKIYHLVLSGLIFFHKHATPALRIWLSHLLALRRIKNSLQNIFFPTEITKAVKRAYHHYGRYHTHY